jgi:hypothetical protein
MVDKHLLLLCHVFVLVLYAVNSHWGFCGVAHDISFKLLPKAGGSFPLFVGWFRGVALFQPFQILLVVCVGGVKGDPCVIVQALDAPRWLAHVVRLKLVHAL